jgi:3-oxoacyl-[acyl-carrier protein] reductase
VSEADATGDVIVVVGGTRGIGAAIATDLATTGARLVLAGRDVDAGEAVAAAIAGAGGSASVFGCDVTSTEDCDALFSRVADLHGRLDTVFANQGVAGPSTRLTNWSAEAIEQSLAVNLLGCLNIARSAESTLGADGGGRLIVTGSGSGHENLIGLGMYGIAKAAVSHLVRQLAVEWRSRPIAVNELIPGPVRTDMTGFGGNEPASPETNAFEAYAEHAKEWLKDPEDVAPLARLLAGFPPNGPTGQTFCLTGRV